MLDMATASRYLTDQHDALLFDVGLMWAIWNMLEFGGELEPIPVYPAKYDDTERFFQGDRLLTVRGMFSTRDEEPKRFITINTALLAELHLDGSYVHSTTLYHKIAETLLHEMVHQWCDQNGIADCEPDGTHNAAFRDAARAHGLTCHEGCNGWNYTEVRKGHWGPFYKYAKAAQSTGDTSLAHDMRATHIRMLDDLKGAA